MRDTPDRQLQLDFQRRAPEPATIALTFRPERAPHFTTLGSLRLPGPGSSIGVFFRSKPRFRRPLMPAPATPAPRERRRIQMRAWNTFVEGRCRVTTAGCHHAMAWPARPRRQPQPTACPNEHDNTHRLLQSTQSSSTLANDRCPALRRFSRTERCALRRSGDAKPHRPLWPRVSAVQGTEAGSGTRTRHPSHWRRPRFTGG